MNADAPASQAFSIAFVNGCAAFKYIDIHSSGELWRWFGNIDIPSLPSLSAPQRSTPIVSYISLTAP